MRRALLFSSCAALLLVLTGCDSPPASELDAARQALDAARSAEADTYAPDEIGKASATLKEAEAEIAVQDESFALTRSYDQARELVSRATSEAEAATAAAGENKAEVKVQAEAANEAAQAAITNAQAMLRKAPRWGKGAREALAAMEGDVASSEAMQAGAQQAYEAGKYMDALNQFGAVKRKADGVSSEIEQAIQQRRRR